VRRSLCVDPLSDVDDNESFLEVVRALLEREGLTVGAVASTYAEAVELFETLRPDVVLVDIFPARRAAWSSRGTSQKTGTGRAMRRR
jgi:DNA-binding NarL/FixJ family response regulator